MDTAYKAADAELFQSTPSARRATDSDLLISVEDDISIHALREEGDLPPCSHSC